MKEIRLFIFDLDGTLIDSSADIAAAVNHTLKQLGEPLLTREEITRNVGDGVLHLLRRSITERHRGRVEEAVAIFRNFYGAHLVDRTVLCPGVSETLALFSLKKKAILTNKPERYIRPILQGLGIEKAIDYAIGGDGKSVPKPSPEPVEKILNRFRVPREKAVMVGDSPVDVETGRSAGIWTCALTSGYRPRSELEACRPDFMVDHMGQLGELFY